MHSQYIINVIYAAFIALHITWAYIMHNTYTHIRYMTQNYQSVEAKNTYSILMIVTKHVYRFENFDIMILNNIEAFHESTKMCLSYNYSSSTMNAQIMCFCQTPQIYERRILIGICNEQMLFAQYSKFCSKVISMRMKGIWYTFNVRKYLIREALNSHIR